MARTQRGSALLVAIIALLVISVIGIGILRFGYREVAGASASYREQSLVACAQAARQLLTSQFHVLGKDPTNLDSFNSSLSDSIRAVGGHYDSTVVSDIQLSQVRVLPAAAFGPASTPRDLSNVIARNATSKQPYKVVVRCQTAAGTELELEFGVKFGL